MLAVEAAGAARPHGTVHFEWFSAKAVAPAQSASTGVFEIILRSSGLRFQVYPEKSILETLEDNGIAVPFACREGLCRTCETPLCSGEADHRDGVLTDNERMAQKSMMVCVSRARTPVLELDI
jgi:vanillate O-demethylase ferredoxin subunit